MQILQTYSVLISDRLHITSTKKESFPDKKETYDKTKWKLKPYHGDTSEASRSSLRVKSSRLVSLISDIRDSEQTDTCRRRSKNGHRLERSVGDAAMHSSSSPRQRVTVLVCHTIHQWITPIISQQCNYSATIQIHDTIRQCCYQQLEHVQQLAGPRFCAIVLDQSAVGQLSAKGPANPQTPGHVYNWYCSVVRELFVNWKVFYNV